MRVDALSSLSSSHATTAALRNSMTAVQAGEQARLGNGSIPVDTPQPTIITRSDGVRTDGAGVRITGHEPPYEPERWNLGAANPVQRFNNCYAYAVNDLQTDRADKPQPGQRAGVELDYFSGGSIDTRRLQSAIAADGRGGNITFLGDTPQSTLRAPEGTYIVALVVDNRDGMQDYHWYRHNPDGSWSGKGGAGRATSLDAGGNLILDPRTANRDYGNQGSGRLNYTEFVGYYAVRSGAQVGPR